MNVEIKKLIKEAVIPRYAKEGDAGLDFTATSVKWNDKEEVWEYGTGIAIKIPDGYVGLMFPRSSIKKKNLILSNHVGVIDSGYTGEIMFAFRESMIMKESDDPSIYIKGDRIGQLVIIPYPQIKFKEVEELSQTARGTSGWGSTGN